MARTFASTLIATFFVLALAPLASGSEAIPVVSPNLQPGQSFSQKFNQTGTLEYHCHPHPWMLAQIVVKASSGREPKNWTVAAVEPPNQEFENWTWSPKTFEIEVNDTVTWINNGSVMHKVQETTAEHADHVGGVEDDHGNGGDHGADGHVDTGPHGVASGIPWWSIPVVFSGVVVLGLFWRDARKP